MERVNSTPSSRTFRRTAAVYLLCGLVYLGFGMEILGILLTDKRLNPLLKPHRFFLIVEITTLALTLLSPGLALGALTLVSSAAREITSPAGRIVIWIVVLVGFLVSMAEGMWTCSGHPTWIQGYPY
jgi:hypothetical protein